MNENETTLIIEWNDTRKTEIKKFRTDDELIEYASIAVFLGAKVCYWTACAGWVWS